MSTTGTLTLKTVEGAGLRFEGRFENLAITLDSGSDQRAPSPPQALLAALAACEGMDVISILRKQRQRVTAYEIAMSGERSAEHPRRFTSIELVHRVRGVDVKAEAVAEAIRLSEQKYCSVHHSLRADIAITNRFEILPA